ncbi:hypothetical protein [Adonisia turfae]|nr:hypothetical protein [Adonisia turfae]
MDKINEKSTKTPINYDVGITWLNGPITHPEFPSEQAAHHVQT